MPEYSAKKVVLKDTEGNYIVPVTENPSWGNIKGTLNNQADLKSALDGKQPTLTAGNNIKIEDNTISVIGELGAKTVFREWED